VKDSTFGSSKVEEHGGGHGVHADMGRVGHLGLTGGGGGGGARLAKQ
jgi:hypothetical protein